MSLVNISIDDVSPHEKSGLGVLKWCEYLIGKFPDIKFTLFIPTAYWRQRKHATNQALNLSLYPEFCDVIRSLDKNNFEICFHGHHHGIIHKSDNDELQHIDEETARQICELMLREAEISGLNDIFKKCIRPPAWRMSHAAMDVFYKAGFNMISLSADDYAVKTYGNGHIVYSDIINYYDCNPPLKALELYHKTEVVYHACEWDSNYLNEQLTLELEEFINSNLNDIEFVFIDKLKGNYEEKFR